MSEKRKLPIDRPCSACSAGDTEMEYHDHHPPFREPVASPQATRKIGISQENENPSCTCGHTKFWHANFGKANCDQCSCPKFVDACAKATRHGESLPELLMCAAQPAAGTTPCEICGEPMPAGEEMFKYHGYSGNCPKPPLMMNDETEAEARLNLPGMSTRELAAIFRTFVKPEQKCDANTHPVHEGISSGITGQNESCEPINKLDVPNADSGQSGNVSECEGTTPQAERPAPAWEQMYRRLLWESHAGYTHSSYLYGDDGEMQCNHRDCMLDFKRELPEALGAHIWQMNLKRLAEARAVAPVETPNARLEWCCKGTDGHEEHCIYHSPVQMNLRRSHPASEGRSAEPGPRVGPPSASRLMVTRGGEIHEECPDCRGECSPYNPAAQTRLTAEQLAQKFHEAYERLAPQFSYETRKASAKPWAEVPENNRRLMIAVCAEILEAFRDKSEAGLREENERLKEGERLLRDFLERDYGVSEITTICSRYDDAEQELTELRAKLANAEKENVRLTGVCSDWSRDFNMYRSAWLRELGGYIIHKHHEIDGFVLRTREIYEKSKRAEAAEAEAAALRERLKSCDKWANAMAAKIDDDTRVYRKEEQQAIWDSRREYERALSAAPQPTK